MAAKTWARDTLAILGGLLITWSLLTVAYTVTLRAPYGDCVQGQWLVAGYCLNAWKWLLIPFGLGVALTLTGLVAFRSDWTFPEDVLKAGPGVRMLMAVLASVAAVPLIGAIVVRALESGTDTPYMLNWQAVQFSQAWFLLTVGLVGLAAFFLGFGVHLSHELRRRRYLDMTEPIAEEPGQEFLEAPPEPGPGELPPEGFAWVDLDEDGTATMKTSEEEALAAT